jgi:hypothetical protein
MAEHPASTSEYSRKHALMLDGATTTPLCPNWRSSMRTILVRGKRQPYVSSACVGGERRAAPFAVSEEKKVYWTARAMASTLSHDTRRTCLSIITCPLSHHHSHTAPCRKFVICITINRYQLHRTITTIALHTIPSPHGPQSSYETCPAKRAASRTRRREVDPETRPARRDTTWSH